MYLAAIGLNQRFFEDSQSPVVSNHYYNGRSLDRNARVQCDSMCQTAGSPPHDLSPLSARRYVVRTHAIYASNCLTGLSGFRYA